MASSESYGIKLRNMRANLAIDRLQLLRIDNVRLRLVDRRDLFGRSRERLVKDIDWQERVLKVAECY
ncbi:MAG: hypothetical protein M3P26_10490 [Gemmatimonadota bacterium]|nr:hypothetical protein [Gemmatimonadota bacterium]